MLFLVAFGLSALAVYESSGYQKCSAEAGCQGSTHQQGQDKGVSLIGRGQVAFLCAMQSISENNPVVSAVATVVIAVFTTILGLFTMSLANSTRIAAEAAKLSAEAAISVELPKLLVSNIDLQEIPDNPSKRKVIVTVTNYGRTPAFLLREAAEIRISAILSRTREYINTRDLGPGAIIDRDAYTMTARLQNFGEVIGYQFPLDGTEKMWAYGFIMYRDFLDKCHTMRFCAEYVVPLDLVKPPRFIQGTCHDQYTQSD